MVWFFLHAIVQVYRQLCSKSSYKKENGVFALEDSLAFLEKLNLELHVTQQLCS